MSFQNPGGQVPSGNFGGSSIASQAISSDMYHAMHGTGQASGSDSLLMKEIANPKLDEIKKHLNGDSNQNKLDAMKRLIAMISKGRNVSYLFPEVVKNVVCTDESVKQLVYMYLIHYAEIEQDAALLSINHFQKDLENPSPLIRAQALRVLSSIRLPMIARILVLGVQKCVTDNSAYVRKTAAHAIAKIYQLEANLKEDLIECIETLLGDNTTLVLGSAVGAFNEICPERFDLIHPHFRKLCNVLADTDEWGQIYMVNLLARYARNQFEDPNEEAHTEKTGTTTKKKKKSFYSDEESEEGDDEADEDEEYVHEMDADHRLLLRATAPLLQSRNCGVVLAVAMLYFHCAPKAEALRVGRALVRVCRENIEYEYIVLNNINTMADTRPEMFAPYVAQFFVFATDPKYIKSLKLEVITKIVSEQSINIVLREFNYYVHMEDRDFVKASIQAIGRCAARLKDVQESCLHGLMGLLRNANDSIVAESIVVIKRLLQLGSSADSVVPHLAKMLPDIKIPDARASIVWVVGEYCDKVPLLAPDILRTLAKSFSNEPNVVKLQVLNLGAKLLLRIPENTINLLFQYICAQAKYDLDYDVRDRARIFRAILVSPSTQQLRNHAKALFCTEKPAPIDISALDESERFLINSLSHIMRHTVPGYLPISEWPDEAPDPSVRNKIPRKQRRDTPGLFGNGPSPWKAPRRDEESSEGSDFYSDYSEYSEEEEEEEEDDDDFYSEPKKKSASRKPPPSKKKQSFYSEESEEEEEEEDESSEEVGFFGSGSTQKPASSGTADFFGGSTQPSKQSQNSGFAGFGQTSSSGSDFFGNSSAPLSQSDPFGNQPTKKQMDSLSNDLLGLGFSSSTSSLNVTPAPVQQDRQKQVLLKQVVGKGLEVQYIYTRRPSLHGSRYVAIQLFFFNMSGGPLQGINIQANSLDNGEEVIPFDEIYIIPPGGNAEAILNVKFSTFTKPLKFDIVHSVDRFTVQLVPSIGELVYSKNIAPGEYAKALSSLGGMNEASDTLPVTGDIAQKVIDFFNVSIVTNDNVVGKYEFAGKTVIDDQDVLISINAAGSGSAKCRVNCGNAIFSNTLLNALKGALAKA